MLVGGGRASRALCRVVVAELSTTFALSVEVRKLGGTHKTRVKCCTLPCKIRYEHGTTMHLP